MAKRYIRLNWQNAPSVATPINAANLNKMDKGIDDIDTALNNLENSIVGQIVDDPTKINNAAVIYSLSNQVDTINNNLGNTNVITAFNNTSYATNASRSNYSVNKKQVVLTLQIVGSFSATTGEVLLHTLDLVPRSLACAPLMDSNGVVIGYVVINVDGTIKIRIREISLASIAYASISFNLA